MSLDKFLGISSESEIIPIIIPKIIPGLIYKPNFITPEEEDELISLINKSKWDTRLTRRVQHYGYIYDYVRQSCNKTDPIPEWCNKILKKIKDIFGQTPDQLIINEYLPGQGIAAHTDSKIFGDYIFSISLGSDIIMNFIDSENVEVKLARCSLICLSEDSRNIWKHEIVPRKTDHGKKRTTRYSLTFRKLV
jgi:alkylated DNA repair dioxygenase AlkB